MIGTTPTLFTLPTGQRFELTKHEARTEQGAVRVVVQRPYTTGGPPMLSELFPAVIVACAELAGLPTDTPGELIYRAPGIWTCDFYPAE